LFLGSLLEASWDISLQ